jgi:hypothetical protein
VRQRPPPQFPVCFQVASRKLPTHGKVVMIHTWKPIVFEIAIYFLHFSGQPMSEPMAI